MTSSVTSVSFISTPSLTSRVSLLSPSDKSTNYCPRRTSFYRYFARTLLQIADNFLRNRSIRRTMSGCPTKSQLRRPSASPTLQFRWKTVLGKRSTLHTQSNLGGREIVWTKRGHSRGLPAPPAPREVASLHSDTKKQVFTTPRLRYPRLSTKTTAHNKHPPTNLSAINYEYRLATLATRISAGGRRHCLKSQKLADG